MTALLRWIQGHHEPGRCAARGRRTMDCAAARVVGPRFALEENHVAFADPSNTCAGSEPSGHLVTRSDGRVS